MAKAIRCSRPDCNSKVRMINKWAPYYNLECDKVYDDHGRVYACDKHFVGLRNCVVCAYESEQAVKKHKADLEAARRSFRQQGYGERAAMAKAVHEVSGQYSDYPYDRMNPVPRERGAEWEAGLRAGTLGYCPHCHNNVACVEGVVLKHWTTNDNGYAIHCVGYGADARR